MIRRGMTPAPVSDAADAEVDDATAVEVVGGADKAGGGRGNAAKARKLTGR